MSTLPINLAILGSLGPTPHPNLTRLPPRLPKRPSIPVRPVAGGLVPKLLT
mgnify:CR=1 FL=1